MVTGRRDPGEPLSWPVRAFPVPVSVPTTPCRSARFGPPASRSGSPPDSGEPVERVGAFRRPPRVLDSPLRLCPSETLRLGTSLPISKSNTVSCFRAWVLPLHREVGPATVTSGLGLSHARSRRPVETVHRRVLSRFICCALHHLRSWGLSLSLSPLCLVISHAAGSSPVASLSRMPPMSSPVQGEALA